MWESTQKNASWMVQKINKAKGYLEATRITMQEMSSWNFFSIKKLYNVMRGEFQKVTWKKLTCNNVGALKWIFMLNLAIQRRLLTRDMLHMWGITYILICPMCNDED